jgi:micrococcal nuclease
MGAKRTLARRTYRQFYAKCELGVKAWSGCSTPPPPPPPPGDCDPAYPPVCIPSPPPDLDCAQTPHRNFRVLAPDPHHFDGDGDGIG